MRIAIVHPYPWPEVRRGAERYLEDLAHYLGGQGHEVSIVTGTRGRKSVERREDNVRILRLRHLSPGPTARLGLSEVETFGLRAIRSLYRQRPDVVHAFTPSAALAGRVTRQRTLYTILGHPDANQMPLARAPRRIFISAVRKASVTAALSRASAEAVHALLGRKAVVLPPGVVLENFSPKLAARAGPPRLLFSASLNDRRKRADLAVGALAIVLEKHPDARLALSGEGDASWVLEGADRAGDHVRSAIDVLGPGRPADVPSRYRDATVTLLPAEHEAFGLALVESLASGTPAVCTPSGGMPEILSDPRVGCVASEASGAALADAVETALGLAADPETPARCVERARRWSWEVAVGPAHERLYTRMMDGSSSPTEAEPW